MSIRTFASLPLLSARRAPAVRRLPPVHRRGIAEDHSNLGGVGGSEPPGPQANPHNWIAGTITVTAVLFIGWRMRAAKLKQKEASQA